MLFAHRSRFISPLLLTMALFVSPFSMSEEVVAVNIDPLESINRKIFVFNDTLDTYIVKPTAQGYQKVAPQFVEDGVTNFFDNLWGINRILNNALQAKFANAGKETVRLLLNTTLGMLGTVDVASNIGMEIYREDFGLTLGYWGVSSGAFLELPILGPSSLRDGVGVVVSWQVDPVNRVDDVPTRNGLTVARGISDRANLLQAEKLITGDKYLFIRDAYLQRRQYLITGESPKDDFGEEDYDE
jgi:phospholipid-binding lipoprotein MlaA